MIYAISACLLGEACRYDGQSKRIDAIVSLAKTETVIPFCPEAPLFGTPRPRIRVVEESGEKRLVRESDGEEVSDAIRDYTQHFLDEHPRIDGAILKSKSPSCGCGTTPIYDLRGNQKGFGNGIAADCFLASDIRVIDENHYIKEEEC